MTLPIIPGGFCAALSENLAEAVETVLGNEARILSSIDLCSMQIFFNF
jgi:hypothetical protein